MKRIRCARDFEFTLAKGALNSEQFCAGGFDHCFKGFVVPIAFAEPHRVRDHGHDVQPVGKGPDARLGMAYMVEILTAVAMVVVRSLRRVYRRALGRRGGAGYRPAFVIVKQTNESSKNSSA
jgi:hypothetical protein